MSNSKRKNFTALNIAKGIIIWMAVFLHSRDFFNDSIRAFDILNNWVCLVVNPFFFISSGFGMIYAYRNRILDTGFFSFMIKRLKKIYPMYLITTIIMFLFTIKADGLGAIKPLDVIQNLLLMTSGWFRNIVPYNIPAWFFSVLMLMYVLFWLVERIFKKKDVYVYIVLTIAGLFLMYKRLNIPFLYYEDGFGVAGFSIGALIGVFYLKYCNSKNGELINIMAAVIMTLLTAAVMMFTPSGMKNVFSEHLFTLFAAPAVLLWVVTGVVNKIMSGVPILDKTIGAITMNVYLWHIIIVRVYNAVCLKVGIYDLVGMKTSYIGYLITTFIGCYLITIFEKRIAKKI